MTAQDMCKLAGVSPRTLDFWVRSGVLSASVSKATGTGSKRRYSGADLVRCKLAVMLRSMGMETSRIAPILRRTRNRQTGFIIIEANGEITSIPKTRGLAKFQPNRTAMLLINVTAIRAGLDLDEPEEGEQLEEFPEESGGGELGLQVQE